MKKVYRQTLMEHKPVMVNEVVESLNLAPGKIVLDCTVGTAGHSRAILGKILPGGRLIGIDKDKESLDFAKDRLSDFSQNISLMHDDFRNIDSVLAGLNVDKVDGMLFDLGVSSFQLDTAERGFSIKVNAPLDMRMDRSSYISAYDLVNNLTQDEIASIIKTFGQERWHNRIARYLIDERKQHPISTTGELSAIILKALPHTVRYQKIHPATRTFQAFRIAVNRELESLEESLRKTIDFLNINGRISVISFHSLEDRIAKNIFKALAKEGRARLINEKPELPGVEEISDNPRSRSAKLRTIEKI